MKYYCVVRLNPRDAVHSTSKALPVRFTDRAQAEEICAELNRTKRKKKATQVSLSKNAKNPDVCFRNRLDCWSIEARKIQTAGSQESFDSAFERICATHHSSPSALAKICYRLRDGEPVMQEPFRLQLNQSWEAVDIQTGAAVVIPKGSHKAVRILHRAARDAKEEPWLVVTVQHRGKPVSVGLREAYWRQWESYHVQEFRVRSRSARLLHPRHGRDQPPVRSKGVSAYSLADPNA